MAKKSQHFVPLNQMSKKDKFLHFLKLFGISFAGVMAMVAGVVVYVWATGGFNPPYVPLTSWAFSQAEYVIDGNKEIELDENGNQKRDENGNLSFIQKKDKNNNDEYEYVMLVPNENCTELNAEIRLSFSSNPDMPDVPVVQLVEDENTKALDVSENDTENTLHKKYSVKIGSPIYIRPVTKLVEDKEVNIGGWIMLTASQDLMQTSCWVFVDVPVDSLNVDIKNKTNYESDSSLDNDEQMEYYLVSQSDVIELENQVLPTTSLKYPSTIVPQSKGSTNFRLSKLDNLKYEIVAGGEGIASIKNGTIRITEGRQGESFAVRAYIYSQYNQIGNLKDLQYYVDDPNRDPSQKPEDLYNRAKNKICVISNTLYFKIKTIEITALNVADMSSSIPVYNLFEEGKIVFSRNITSSSKNNYYTDLVLSENVTDGYKDVLLKDVKLAFVMKQTGEVIPKEIISSLEDIIIDDSLIADASNYIYLKQVGNDWKYVVKQFASNEFYLVFYYELQDSHTLVFNYIPILLAEREVTEIQVKQDEINLDKEETYSLKDFASVVPNNSTYNTIMYFVDVNDDILVVDDTSICITDNNIVNGKVLYPISVTKKDNNEQVILDELGQAVIDYNLISPKNIGTTRLYIAVLKKVPVVDEDTCQIIGYDYLKEDNYIKWAYCYDQVIVNVTKDVEFTSIEVNNELCEGLESEDNPNPNLYTIYATIYQGGKINVTIGFDDEEYFMDNRDIDIKNAQSETSLVASIDNLDNSVSGMYSFDVLANRVGETIYQIIYNSSKGEQVKYTIGIKVLSTELIGISIETDNNQVTVSFQGSEIDSDGKSLKATDYVWNDLNVDILLNSPMSNASYELRTYKIPNNFNEEILSCYVGKDYEEIINNSALNNTNNSIKKFINLLEIDKSIIEIDNLDLQNYDAYINIGNNKIGYNFVSTGKILLVIEATNGVCSNPILLEVPEIDVDIVYGLETEQSSNVRTIYSQGALNPVLKDEDFKTPAKQIDIRKTTNDRDINFYAIVNNQKYNISSLVDFRFAQQDLSNKNKSAVSGAELSKERETYMLSLIDVSRPIQETIVAYTQFGYVNDEFYYYNLEPDYKLINNLPNKEYLTPAIVDIFDPTIIMITNAEFDISNTTGNKLFLPQGYINSLSMLNNFIDKLSNDIKNSLYYKDNSDTESYYHIYTNLKISNSSAGTTGQDYDYRPAQNGKIALSYKEDSSIIFVNMEAPAGKIINVRLKSKPAIKSDFVYNLNNYFAISASSISDFNILLDDKLLFTGFDGNNLIDFNVNINNINFAITNQTNSDLLFFNTENGNIIEGYTPIDQDYYNYITENQYNSLKLEDYFKTQDLEIDLSKDYYVKHFVQLTSLDNYDLNNLYELIDDEYVKVEDETLDNSKTYYFLQYKKVENPIVDNIAEYYETGYIRYFVSSKDEIIDNDKNYYEYTNYVIVKEPNIDLISSYYVIVDNEYIKTSDTEIDTNKTYYVKENDYSYQIVPQDRVIIADLSKYFEAVYSKEEYYELSQPTYIQVDMPTSQYSSIYYEKLNDGTYALISNYDDNGTYYYKENYAKIKANHCIDNSFYKFTVKLTKEQNGDNYSYNIELSQNVKHIMQTLYLTLDLKVDIVNIQDNYTYSYSGFYYNIMIEGFEQ